MQSSESVNQEQVETIESWFTVDQKGLRQMQERKPKTHIVRELVQNAFDEPIKNCNVHIAQTKTGSMDSNTIFIGVEDDSPIGFRRIDDAYTLFAPTYKRSQADKRGRFNIGEKQAISMCEVATIETTKGTVRFVPAGRQVLNTKRKKGTKVSVQFYGTPKEYLEIIEYAKNMIPPEGITYTVNQEEVPTRSPYQTFKATLPTEFEKDGQMRQTERKTDLFLYEPEDEEEATIYELGIPVATITCPWHVDVQQRIPMGIDRDAVSTAFIQDIYAEVLTHMVDELLPEDISEPWIRTAIRDKRITKPTMQTIIQKRYGENVCIANPNDPNAMDDAISAGFRPVYGAEMSKAEWDKVKEFGLMQTVSEMFGKDFADAEYLEPDLPMRRMEELTRRIASFCLRTDVTVLFLKSKANTAADYGNQTVRYNVSRLGKNFFTSPLERRIDLIVHELGHEYGNHTEKDYHEAITKMAGKLVVKALEDPDFFNLEEVE